jgi:hypothetical protein
MIGSVYAVSVMGSLDVMGFVVWVLLGWGVVGEWVVLVWLFLSLGVFGGWGWLGCAASVMHE